MSTQGKLGFFILLLIVAAVFFAVGVGLTASLNKVTVAEGAVDKPVSVPEPNAFLTSSQESFRNIVEAVTPAVCTVEVITRVPGHPTGMGNMFDLNPFFGPRQQRPQQQPEDMEIPSSGSGFLVSSDGYLLTNNHVVQGADEIKVILDGNNEYEATIIGQDPDTNVAVLKIESNKPFSYIELGDSEEIKVGDWVMAIGNPFGYLDHSVTVGVISAKNRESITGTQYENFLQTDAAINFGNSGGPLVDIYGRAVGINTAISSQGSGIGFAVPINMARHVYDDFRNYGEVRRGWVGISIETLTEERAEEVGVDYVEGALVLSVSDGDPAEQAGIEVNDIVIDVEGETIRTASQLSRIIAAMPVGEPFEASVLRDGKKVKVSIVPSLRGDDPIIHGGDNESYVEEIGITILDISQRMRDDGLIPEDVDGVIVYKLDPNSPAIRKGVEPGVVITHIDSEKVDSVEEFIEKFDAIKDKDTIVFDILYINDDGSTDADVIALRLKK